MAFTRLDFVSNRGYLVTTVYDYVRASRDYAMIQRKSVAVVMPLPGAE